MGVDPMKRCFGLIDRAVLGAIVLAQSAAVLAQDADTAPDQGLQEVIVTAEKRPSVEQKTAIAMTVFDAKALERNGVGNVSDLAAIAPSVSFATSNATNIITIRGISSRDTTEIGDPAVALNIDGFTLQRAIGLNATIFDLERVEVLRGPQGTLVGRNATGGAINIITAKPTNSFAAHAAAEVGDYSTFNTEGMLNLPIESWLKIRAAVQTRNHHGYRDNDPAHDGDDERSKAGRLHVALDPTDKWSVLLTGEWTELTGVGPVVQPIAQVYTAPGIVDLRRPAIPNDGTSFPVPPGGFITTTVRNFRATTTYDFGPMTLTYLGGWRGMDFQRLATLGGTYGSVRQNFAFNQTERPDSWNHEVRLTSTDTGPFKWQVGGYYFKESNSLLTLFQDYPGSPTLSGPFINLQTYVYPDIVAKSHAYFGQASYEIADGLKFEAGARRSTDDKHRIGYNTVTNIARYVQTGCTPATCAFVTTQQNSRTTSEKTTYHAAIDWQRTPTNLNYLKFDTGYKAGGFTDIGQYGPETIAGFELGSKNRFLDNRLQVNLDAYAYEYKDQQVSQAVTTAAGAVGTNIVNAGKTRIWGAEIESIAALTPRDQIDLFIGYLHSRFQDFKVAVSGQLAGIAYAEGNCTPVTAGVAMPCNWQLAGRTAPQAPQVSLNFGYEHRWPLFGGELTTRVQTHFESKSYFTFYNFDADSQPAYSRSDAIVTYTSPSRSWEVKAFVHNIEDKLILAVAQDPSTQTYSSYRYQYQPPRTYGVRFTYDW
jgi:iron complex outermembrane receptor protein